MFDSKSRLSLTILLAIDDSWSSQAAINLLTHINWPAGTAVQVLAVVPEKLPELNSKEQNEEDEQLAIRRWRDWAAAKIATAETAVKLQGHNLTVNTEIREGPLAELILAHAVGSSTDLIVIDAKNFNSLSEFHLSSATHDKLAHHASYASILVTRPSKQIRPINTMVIIEDSPETWRAIEFISALSLPQWAKVTVINVAPEQEAVPPGRASSSCESTRAYPLPVNDAAEQFDTQVIDHLHYCGTRVWHTYHLEKSADVILPATQEQQADLIVIGAAHQTQDQPFRPDNFTREIVKHASCSVMVIR